MSGGNPTIRVISFGGGFNLPLWAAQAQAMFAHHGVAIELIFTADSRQVFSGLMDGRYDVAITALDNILAYQQGHAERVFEPPSDFFAFMGSDDGFLSLVAAPHIVSVADLAGQPVSVDDPGNGFALALREMMRHHGLSPHDVRWELAGGTDRRYAALMEGRHAATMLRAPFDLMAQANGFRRLATTRETIGPYLGIVGAARRSWAANHEVSLVAFIRAYRDAVRWLKQPTNREDACRLLIQHQPQMSAPLAAEACAVLLDPLTGFFDDVRLDAAGVQAVIDLRAGSLPTGRPMREPLNCVDDRFWRLA